MTLMVAGKHADGSEIPMKVATDGTLEVNATVSSTALPTGAATAANQTTALTRLGDVTETAPTTDTASSGLNGRLQRIAQRITAVIGALPTALTGVGNLKVSVEEAFSNTYAHISTATTTVVKSGAGTLRSICVNTKGTVASTVTVYDNTAGSGTKIAVIDSLSALGTYIYDVAFSTGLTVVSTGTVAPDITVSYR